MDCVEARSTTNNIARGREVGMPIIARQMADGRCVNTIVLTLPNRLAIDAATRTDAACTILVLKKNVPSWPSLMLKCFLK